MCLYSKLGELCVDPRPAVRKSAGQTLFSTISAHGSLLENITWYTALWRVIIALLSVDQLLILHSGSFIFSRQLEKRNLILGQVNTPFRQLINLSFLFTVISDDVLKGDVIH